MLTKARSPWVPYFYWLTLIVIWLAALAARALISPDEGRYATLAMAMLQSGDWVTPRLNGLLYFEKPPFQYWAGALSFMVFGINEFAARFWPGLSGLLTVACVATTGRRLWSREAGHLAALVCAGSLWVLGNSHFLTLDMGLCFFLTLTLCAFLLAQHDEATPKAQRIFMCLAWAGMAGATLSKGLVGLLIPGCSLFFYSLCCWHWKPWKRMAWVSGLLLFLTLSAPWFWLVSERNVDFAHFFFIHEHFERFLTTEHRRVGALWYFVPILLVGFLPWTSFLPRLFVDAWKKRLAHFQCARFLLVWCIFVFVFFSKSGSKLPSYILPMFPALSLLLGQLLLNYRVTQLKKHLLVPILLALIALALLPFAEYFTPENTPTTAIRYLLFFVGFGMSALLISALLAWRFFGQERREAGVMALALGSIVAFLLVGSGHNEYGQLKSAKALAAVVIPLLTPDTQIYAIRHYDQTLPFYLKRRLIFVEYVDEFDLGEKAEPERWIPHIEQFIERWQSASQAFAYMEKSTFAELTQRHVAMHIVFEDERRVVVAKVSGTT